MTSKSQYRTGLLIGRFQPFHLGHLFLIKKALKQVDGLILGIGSANLINENNPLSYRLRKHMLDTVIARESLNERIIKIIAVNDYPDDQYWLTKTLEKSGKVDVVIGNNAWVNGIFKNAGYPVLELGLYKRYLYESRKIRKLIKEGKKWEKRVPEYLINDIKNQSASWRTKIKI